MRVCGIVDLITSKVGLVGERNARGAACQINGRIPASFPCAQVQHVEFPVCGTNTVLIVSCFPDCQSRDMEAGGNFSDTNRWIALCQFSVPLLIHILSYWTFSSLGHTRNQTIFSHISVNITEYASIWNSSSLPIYLNGSGALTIQNQR
jgi:hypothetical protein